MRKTHVTHFRVDGADLTRIFRDVMMSEEPAKAWRLVVACLRGPGGMEQHAAKILDGKLTLTGNETDGIEVVTDNAKDYFKSLKYIYAGRVRIDGSWWRPRAEVTHFSPEDARYASEEYTRGGEISDLAEGVARKVNFYRNRVAFYRREGERVVEVTRKVGKKTGKHFIIFEAVGEPPFWWEEHKSPTDALNNFLASGRTLDSESWEADFEGPRDVVAEEDAATEAYERSLADEEHQRAEIRRAEEWATRFTSYTKEIKERAGDDFMDLHLPDGKVVARVPRAPFVCWALSRTSLKHLAPPWETVCPSGLKLPMDEPYHSDWVLGGGLDLGEIYGTDIDKASTHEMGEIQHQFGFFTATVLVDAGEVSGVLGKEILVLPNLHPDHLEAMMKAKAVITEAGGKLAHLAQVAMEHRITIILVPDARTRYLDGMHVSIDPSEGQVHIHWAVR